MITKEPSLYLGSSLTTFTKSLVFFSTLAGSKVLAFRLPRSISSAGATSINFFDLSQFAIVDLGILKAFDSVYTANSKEELIKTLERGLG